MQGPRIQREHTSRNNVPLLCAFQYGSPGVKGLRSKRKLMELDKEQSYRKKRKEKLESKIKKQNKKKKFKRENISQMPKTNEGKKQIQNMFFHIFERVVSFQCPVWDSRR